MRLFVRFSRMSGELRRRRGKDQPAMTGVDRLETEHIAQKSPDFIGVW